MRTGYQQITLRFTIKGDAPAEKLHELLDQSRARSAVDDVITNQVPITIKVDTPDTQRNVHLSTCQVAATRQRTVRG